MLVTPNDTPVTVPVPIEPPIGVGLATATNVSMVLQVPPFVRSYTSEGMPSHKVVTPVIGPGTGFTVTLCVTAVGHPGKV